MPGAAIARTSLSASSLFMALRTDLASIKHACAIDAMDSRHPDLPACRAMRQYTRNS